MRGAFRVWQRNVTIFRKFWISGLFPNFIEPLIYLAALGLGLGAFIQQGGINGQSYVEYIAPGLLASNAMFAASFESTFNTFVKLRFDKIYDAIITTPVNAEDVVAGEYLWAGTRAALYGTGFLGMLIVLGTAFGEPLITSWWALFIPPVLLADRDHVQRPGNVVHQPDQPHRPLRLLLHPGRDAPVPVLGHLLPGRELPRARPAGRLVHPALPRGQRVQGARHGSLARGARGRCLDLHLHRRSRPIPVQIMRRRLIG